jgi:hypothetical protein
MNVAVFDTQHYEMVHVLHSVFDDPKNNISFFTNSSLLKKIQASELATRPYSSVVLNDHKNSEEFFEACLRHVKEKKIEAIIFNTIDGDYKNVWRFIKQLNIPVMVTIHNINTWLRPPVTFNTKALGYYYYRRKIIAKTSAIIVQEELFIDYVKQNTSYKKPVFALPHTLKEKEIPAAINSKLTIAIPGAVDGHRRNYGFAVSAIKNACLSNSNLRFIIIGDIIGPIGEAIFAQLKELQKQGCDISQVYDASSNKLFDEQMSACDIVFLPLKVETKYEGIEEIYGRSKVTGVLYDLMRFQKPGIAPVELVIPPTMKDSVITYRNEKEFIDAVNSLQKNKIELSELSNKVHSDSEYYKVETIRKRFLPAFEKLISEKQAI